MWDIVTYVLINLSSEMLSSSKTLFDFDDEYFLHPQYYIWIFKYHSLLYLILDVFCLKSYYKYTPMKDNACPSAHPILFFRITPHTDLLHPLIKINYLKVLISDSCSRLVLLQ